MFYLLKIIRQQNASKYNALISNKVHQIKNLRMGLKNTMDLMTK